jgi:hypothetical protein
MSCALKSEITMYIFGNYMHPAALGRECGQLQTIDLRLCQGITYIGISSLGHGYGQPQTIYFSDCQGITDVGLWADPANRWVRYHLTGQRPECRGRNGTGTTRTSVMLCRILDQIDEWIFLQNTSCKKLIGLINDQRLLLKMLFSSRVSKA